jgi:hypothetical protein
LPEKISLDEKHNKRIFSERITYVKNAQENKEEIKFKDEKNINYNYKTYIGIPLAKEKTKYGISRIIYPFLYKRIFGFRIRAFTYYRKSINSNHSKCKTF